MAAAPREKHLEYKNYVDTKKYQREVLRRRNTQCLHVCHNQGRSVCVSQAYVAGDMEGHLAKQEVFFWLL